MQETRLIFFVKRKVRANARKEAFRIRNAHFDAPFELAKQKIALTVQCTTDGSCTVMVIEMHPVCFIDRRSTERATVPLGLNECISCLFDLLSEQPCHCLQSTG